MPTSTVLFAGGGTGGHIYPNAAIADRLRDRLRDRLPEMGIHFLVSQRPGDARTMAKLGEAFTANPVKPLPSPRQLWRAPGFLLAWRRGVGEAVEVLRAHHVAVVVATGGFVSGPAIVAAAKLGLPRAMVNLDAIPGRANRRIYPRCTKVFSAHATPMLPGAEIIGLPLRSSSRWTSDAQAARLQLGLDPARRVVFVTGATHGAQSIILAMMKIVSDPAKAQAFSGWQVLHQCGTFNVATLQAAYDAAGVPAKAVAYIDGMGQAYGAADLVVSRAGAGSVAEAWANARATLFLPNPYHADGHQRHNAAAVAGAGGAMIVEDHVDPAHNAADFGRQLLGLMGDHQRRATMAAASRESRPPEGANVVSKWIAEIMDNDV